MKVTLASGKVYDVVSVEESYYPRNAQGVMLNIRMNSAEEVGVLKDAFTPAELESVTVGEGEEAKTVVGYTEVDSIRKFYGGDANYNTAVDLIAR